MKKYLALFLALMCVVTALAACGGEGETKDNTSSKVNSSPAESSLDNSEEASNTSNDNTSNGVADVDMTALQTELEGKMSVEETFAMIPEAIFNDVGIDPATFSEGFWLCDSNALSAEVVAVYKANSEADGETIRGQLTTKLASLNSQYKDYNADNYAMTQSAVVGGTGVYAYMIISPNVSELDSAVKAALGL